MLSDFAKGILRANRINEEDVVDVSSDMEVTFKDGSTKRICETWTRVMGYLRPTTDFNKGKFSEYKSRKCFTEDKIDTTPDDAA